MAPGAVTDHWHEELERIFALAAQKRAQVSAFADEKCWLVFGIGTRGRSCARILRSHGLEVRAFVDSKAQPGMIVDGIPVLPRQSLDAAGKDLPMVLAVHNPAVDTHALRLELIRAGFARVHLLQDVVGAFPELAHFWLAPGGVTLDDTVAATAGLEEFCDEASWRLYCAILAFRLLGEACPAPEQDQYFPSSVPAAPLPLRWVDCGAFEGDTLDYVEQRGLPVAWCAAFEPDPVNYAKLAARHAGRAMLIPCGVSRTMQRARFMPDGPSGRIDQADQAEGGIDVQLGSLDGMLGGMEFNFLKMDIEGAELAALEGAAGSIARLQPRLALAGYHTPRQMWEIPAACREIGSAGRFMLRVHSWSTFDAVIYGVSP